MSRVWQTKMQEAGTMDTAYPGEKKMKAAPKDMHGRKAGKKKKNKKGY